MIAGRFPNRPDTLTLWLRDAPALDPGVAMPASGLSEAGARDVAAYLYTLDD
jgi:sulfur-oxidizing protein SoxX